jgi:hypothetical protein
MKKRNPIAVFGLSIITLGIYDLYWLVKTKAVLNKETNYKTPSIWLLFLPFAVLIAGYVVLVATVTTSQNTINNGYSYTYGNQGSDINHASVVGFILIGLGFVTTFFISAYWFFKFSKAVNQYTQGRMSTSVTFLVLWIVHLIGVALIQDTFNDMIDGIPAVGPPVPVNAVAPSAPVQPSQPGSEEDKN